MYTFLTKSKQNKTKSLRKPIPKKYYIYTVPSFKLVKYKRRIFRLKDRKIWGGASLFKNIDKNKIKNKK